MPKVNKDSIFPFVIGTTFGIVLMGFLNKNKNKGNTAQTYLPGTSNPYPAATPGGGPANVNEAQYRAQLVNNIMAKYRNDPNFTWTPDMLKYQTTEVLKQIFANNTYNP